MELVELTASDKNLYNYFVASQSTGSFLQSWEWGDWQAKLGRPVFRFFLTEGEHVLASVQAVKYFLPFGQYYVYVPYGPVADLSFKIEHLNFILQGLRDRFSDAVFFRIEPKSTPNFSPATSSLPILKSANIQPGKTLVLDLQKSQGQLLAAMHYKTRYNIKLAQKHSVNVAWDLAVVPGYGLYMQEAIDLIMNTAGRQSFQTFPASYYRDLLNFFGLENSSSAVKLYVYRATWQKELLAAAIMVDFGKVRTYLFGGSSSVHREKMAPYLLHFAAIQDAQKAGLKIYDFWGAETSSGEAPGFVRFKMGFGGSLNEYAGTYDLPAKKFRYWLYKMLRLVNRLRKKV